MPTRPRQRDKAAPLPRRAEKLLREPVPRRIKREPAGAEVAIDERRVPQFDLELQNEELRRAQAELIEARDDYRNFSDFAPVGFLTLDIHRIVRQANLTAATLLGVERSKLVGMRVERLAAPEDRDALYLHLESVKKSPGNHTCHLLLERRDGTMFFARLESSLAEPPVERRGYYRVAITDVTSLHRSEKAVGDSERRFRALTEKSVDGIAIVDAAGKIAYVNPSAGAIFGPGRDELIGRSGFDFVHADDRPKAEQFFRDVASTPGHSRVIELRAYARDGSERWLHLVATNLLDDPAIEGIVVNSHDVTHLRESADELRRMNESLDRLVQERTEAIQMLHDVASMANRAQNAEEAIDYCLHRLTAFSWCFGHALTPAKDRDDVLVSQLQCYPNDARRFLPFGAATETMTFDGSRGIVGKVFTTRQPVWTNRLGNDLSEPRARLAGELGLNTAVAFPVLLGEKVVAVLEFFSDRVIPPDERFSDVVGSVGIQLSRVVERTYFEERLLSIADEIQQAVAQDLHDDLGQELTGLGLKAETLSDIIGGESPRSAKLAHDVAAGVERAREKARSLARRILPIELELGSLPLALAELAATACVGTRTVCAFRNAHRESLFEGRIATQLYRIAQESVSNAIRHGEARHVSIELADDDGQTVLSIADDGRGISSETAHHEGLGLRIMRYRAGLIGGTLKIESAQPQGTIVRCRVTLSEKTERDGRRS